MALLKNISRTLGGKAMPATIYMVVALSYFICNSLGVNIYIVRSLYIVYYFLSFVYVIKANWKGSNPNYIKALDAFLVIILTYIVVDIIIKGIQPIGAAGNLDFLIWHFQATTPIFAFYYFGKKNMISEQWIRFFFVFCLVAVYFSFMSNQKLLANIYLGSESTNNVGYSVVCLLPLTFFLGDRNFIRYASVGIISVFTILSFKRGAVLCLSISLVYLFYTEFVVGRRMFGAKKVGTSALIIIVLVFLYYFINRLYQTSDYFLLRVEQTLEGSTSNRDVIYSSFWQFFKDSELSKQIFGHGVLATRQELGIEAHNDWLEYLIDIGLFGIIFYIIYWIVFIKSYLKSRRLCESNVSRALGMIVIIYLIRSFISMSFYDMQFYSSIVLGYSIAMLNKNKKILVFNE